MQAKSLKIGDHVIFKKRRRRVMRLYNNIASKSVSICFSNYPAVEVRDIYKFKSPNGFADLPLFLDRIENDVVNAVNVVPSKVTTPTLAVFDAQEVSLPLSFSTGLF